MKEKMVICKKAEHCKDRNIQIGIHCKPHRKTFDCPRCVPVKAKKLNGEGGKG